MSDTIAVMYLGQIVEMAQAEALFRKQLHPYTQALISAIPPLEPGSWQDEGTLKGELSSPIDPVPGCRFAPRCPLAMEKCLGHDPPLLESVPGRFSSCIRAKEMI